jgi:hypothetical protein
VCQKRPSIEAKETYYIVVKRDVLQCQKRPTSVKRDLLQCQKRPTTVSKETYYIVVKRDLLHWPYLERVCVCQKRPAKEGKRPSIEAKET